MAKNKIVVVGTRPNLIKLPSFFKLEGKLKIVWIGQHWDKELTDFIYKDLDIPRPEIYKSIGRTAKGQGDFIAKAITATEEIIQELKPEELFVVGDCNVTLAAAIAAKKNDIKLCHIEAGCRADSAVQEELNRRMVDQISDVLYAPDAFCMDNLYREHVKGKIILSHNFQAETLRLFNFLSHPPQKHLVLTLHRRENVTDEVKLRRILNTIVSKLKGKGYVIYFPVHPHTKKMMEEYGLWDDFTANEFINISKSMSYKTFLNLVARSSGVITDSGGLQVEADLLDKPCVTVRDSTEWVYTTSNKNRVVGSSKAGIGAGMDYLLNYY